MTSSERTCDACGMTVRPDDPDPCLGWLPNVAYACCGHGDPAAAYVLFNDGRSVPPNLNPKLTFDFEGVPSDFDAHVRVVRCPHGKGRIELTGSVMTHVAVKNAWCPECWREQT